MSERITERLRLCFNRYANVCESNGLVPSDDTEAALGPVRQAADAIDAAFVAKDARIAELERILEGITVPDQSRPDAIWGDEGGLMLCLTPMDHDRLSVSITRESGSTSLQLAAVTLANYRVCRLANTALRINRNWMDRCEQKAKGLKNG